MIQPAGPWSFHPRRGIRAWSGRARLRRMWRFAKIFGPVLLGVGLVSCGGSDKPAVCSSVDNLKTSVDNLKNVNLRANGLTELSNDLAQVKTDFRQVKKDAKSQYSSQVQKINGDISA